VSASAEGDDRQLVESDLEDRDVGLRVRAHHLGGGLAAVAELHLDLVGAVDHVVVGEQVALARHDDTRPRPICGSCCIWRERSPKKNWNHGSLP
jgi:hypothetical protein